MRTHSELFMQALQTDSNMEMDWLWLADNVTSDFEREYSLAKALYVNPGSEEARTQLNALRRSRKSKYTTTEIRMAVGETYTK